MPPLTKYRPKLVRSVDSKVPVYVKPLSRVKPRVVVRSLEDYLPRYPEYGYLTSTPKRASPVPFWDISPVSRPRKRWVLPQKPARVVELPLWARKKQSPVVVMNNSAKTFFDELELPIWARKKQSPIVVINKDSPVYAPRHAYTPSRIVYQISPQRHIQPRQLAFENETESYSDDYYQTSTSTNTSDDPPDVDYEISHRNERELEYA